LSENISFRFMAAGVADMLMSVSCNIASIFIKNEFCFLRLPAQCAC
jgi:hypothetical protein